MKQRWRLLGLRGSKRKNGCLILFIQYISVSYKFAYCFHYPFTKPTIHSNVKQKTTETRLAENEPRSENGMLTCAEELGLNLPVPPYFVCMQAAKVLAGLRICTDSSESSLLADVI